MFDTICSQLRPYLSDDHYISKNVEPPEEIEFTAREVRFWSKIYQKRGNISDDIRPQQLDNNDMANESDRDRK